MGLIWKYFTSDKRKSALSFTQNLLNIIIAGGTFDNAKTSYVQKIYTRLSISQGDIAMIAKKGVPLYVPKSSSERLEQLYEVIAVQVMGSDNLTPEESVLILNLTFSFGFTADLSGDLLTGLRETTKIASSGLSPEMVQVKGREKLTELFRLVKQKYGLSL